MRESTPTKKKGSGGGRYGGSSGTRGANDDSSDSDSGSGKRNGNTLRKPLIKQNGETRFAVDPTLIEEPNIQAASASAAAASRANANIEDDEEDEDDEEACAREQYLPIAALDLDVNLILHFRQYGRKSRVPNTLTILPS